MVGGVLGTLVMKTPFSWLLGIVAVLALSGLASPSYAQPQQNPAPAPAPAPPQNPAPTPAPAKRTITVNFDYDFGATPACPQPKGKPCVQQFVVYDVSGGVSPKRRFQLFTIPVPTGAKGIVKGITGTSGPLSFEPGKHLLAVSAQTPDQKDSELRSCRFSIIIP